jgi:hypothetical protein
MSPDDVFIVALVIAFFGIIAWLSIQSRRQAPSPHSAPQSKSPPAAAPDGTATNGTVRGASREA